MSDMYQYYLQYFRRNYCYNCSTLSSCSVGKDNQQTGNQAEAAQMNGLQPEELSQLREQLEELQRQNQLLQTQLTEKDSLVTRMSVQ